MAREPISDATRNLGARVRSFRQDRELSQEGLAERAGVHWTMVSQVERGLRNLNLHNLLKLADGLGVDAGKLVSGLHAPTENDA